MRATLRWGLIAALLGLTGGAFAAERLGPDGFPVGWKPEDFKVVSGTIAKPLFAQGGSGTVISSPSIVPVPVSTAVVMGAVAVGGGDSGKAMPLLQDFGVLTPDSGGAGADVWQQASRAVQDERILKSMSTGVASPVLREAWRRVLLAKATAPKVAAGDAVSGTLPLWLGVRAGALDRMGFYEAAWSLWREVPAGMAKDDASLTYGWAQARLLAGQAADACPLAREEATVGTDSRWAVMVAVCQLTTATTGLGPGVPSSPAANLSLQLVEPVLRSDNPRLWAVLKAVQDGKTVPVGNGAVDALGGVVLAAYPAAIWAEGALYFPDTILRRLSVSEALPLHLRARAALQLAAITNWPADGAHAWQLAQAANVSASLPGGVSVTLPVVLPDAVTLAKGIVAEKAVSATAPGNLTAANPVAAYTKALLRNGEVALAAHALPKWQPNPERPLEVRIYMQAKLALAALQGNVDAGLWDAWLAAQPLQSPLVAQSAQRTLAVVDGMGVTVPPSIWQALSDKAGPVVMAVDPATTRLLADVVKSRDVPGILAVITRGWGGMPADRVAPELAGASVAALREAGFNDLARRLAVEAMLGTDQSPLRVDTVKGRKATALPSAETQPGERPMTGNLNGLPRKGGMQATAQDDIVMPAAPMAPSIHKPKVAKLGLLKPKSEPLDLMKDSY